MKLSWHRRRVHLRHPWNIARMARSDVTEKEVLLVTIDHAGRTGWGGCAPSSYYHQSLDSGEAMLRDASGVLGDDPFAMEEILRRLWTRWGGESAAIAAIDEALHDLTGKLLGMPTWKLLGLGPAHCGAGEAPLPQHYLTSFTIGIGNIEVIADRVREAAEYPILKIKVGTPHDREVLDIVRREVPDKPLRVDANCGYAPETVLERCRELMAYNVEFIEQPTPAGHRDVLCRVREAGIGPLVADEDCVNIEDVLPCAASFEAINIKLSKCGGIRRALEMIHTARAAGLKIMLGCMVETSVGIAAAAQLAPLVDYLDLDGHLLLLDDPFEGVGGQAGRLTLSERPGLGAVERST